jgi:allophanate hydrolase
LDITSLHKRYEEKQTSPSEVIRSIYDQIRQTGERPIWITLVDEEAAVARAYELEATTDKLGLPLFGIPFAVKDNFDVAGLPTTAACPDFSREPSSTAEVIVRLINAGAILIGKTNMDQFATGLVGTRTPYGVCSSVFDSEYISGGSSSGSACAVALGLVSFSLGTDTAGSGRVPAAFNNLVGLKPTRGLISTDGVLPACRTLDCVSIFAETCADAQRVFNIACSSSVKDAYSRTATPGSGATPWTASRFTFGVPNDESLTFFGDEAARASFTEAIRAVQQLGGELIHFDYEPFRKVASLLYNGPWVAERLAAIKDFAETHPSSIDPIVKSIITGAERFTAADAFNAAYALEDLRKSTNDVLNKVDFLLLPTAPTHYKIAEVKASPIQLNSNLGYYTNFVNLLDLAAVAVPAGITKRGLPFGVSLVGNAFTDQGLLEIGDRLHRTVASTLGRSTRPLAATPAVVQNAQPQACILMAVVGAHLTGQPLNHQMTDRKSRFVRTVRTHRDYRLYVLPKSSPAKPGLVYSPGVAGPGIEMEIWAMPEDTIGSFLNGIPAPLSLGTVRLEDGTTVKGFLCEPAGIEGAEEITDLGGWRAYLQSK